MKHALAASLAVLASASAMPAAAAYQFHLDTFAVARGFPDGTPGLEAFNLPDSVPFVDEFDDGNPPPDLTSAFNDDQDGDGTPDFSYFVDAASNGTVGPEFPETLRLDSSNGVVAANADGNLRNRQIVLLDAQPGTGLGKDVTFAAGVNYQWSIPGLDQGYGVRVQDRNAVIAGDDMITLRVHGLGNGQAEIQLLRSVYETTNGLTLGNHTLAAQTIAAPANAAFIALGLVHATAGSDDLQAGWYFSDANYNRIDGAEGSFATAATLFHGETSGYRAGFVASEPVPEPAEYALMLAGLALVGWAARRKRA